MTDPLAAPVRTASLSGRSWRYILRKTWREFNEDQCTDLAAALTYYAVLALGPGMLALVSVLGLVGQGDNGTKAALDTIDPLVSQDVYNLFSNAINGVTQSNAVGIGLVVGLLGALWSASGYVGAFGRAMNRIYEVDEGRPFWKLRPVMLLLTFIAVVLAALALVILVVSGPLLESIGNVVGLGPTALLVWKVAKWPMLAVIVVVIVSLLYYATPNVKQPKFRLLSIGALVAIAIWVVASVGFGIYVAHSRSYDRTYGTIAGTIIALLWLWITNVALLFGGELDAEIERGRQLEGGIPAEESIQLPERDTSTFAKARKAQEKDIAEGRDIRRRAHD